MPTMKIERPQRIIAMLPLAPSDFLPRMRNASSDSSRLPGAFFEARRETQTKAANSPSTIARLDPTVISGAVEERIGVVEDVSLASVRFSSGLSGTGVKVERVIVTSGKSFWFAACRAEPANRLTMMMPSERMQEVTRNLFSKTRAASGLTMVSMLGAGPCKIS